MIVVEIEVPNEVALTATKTLISQNADKEKTEEILEGIENLLEKTSAVLYFKDDVDLRYILDELAEPCGEDRYKISDPDLF